MQHVIVVIIVFAVILYFAYHIRCRLKGRDGDCKCESYEKACGKDNDVNCDDNFICGSMTDSCGDCPLRQRRVTKKGKE